MSDCDEEHEPLDFSGLTQFDRYPRAVKEKLLADLGQERVPRLAEHNELYKAFLTSPEAYLAELDRLMCRRAEEHLARVRVPKDRDRER